MGTKSFVQIEINAVLPLLPVKCNFVQVYSTTLNIAIKEQQKPQLIHEKKSRWPTAFLNPHKR
jgi:hypothetical protein